MPERAGRRRSELGLALVAMLVCVVAVGATLRSAGGVSSAQGEVATTDSLSTVELRALARQATLRVAAGSCGHVTRGSGFVIGDWLLTNEHVVRGAAELKADQPIDPVIVPVVARSVLADIAASPAPAGLSLALAGAPAMIDDVVVVAGHADGGEIEVQEATVANRVPGTVFGHETDVLLIDVQTRGGYSGGPVLDGDGNVVAMLAGFDRSTELSVAVPADEIAVFLGGLPERVVDREVEPCRNR